MAASNISNTLISTTTGDAFTGVLHVTRIKCSSSTNAGIVTVTVKTGAGSPVTVYTNQLGATSSPQADEVNIRVSQGQTLTVNTSATGITTYLYIK